MFPPPGTQVIQLDIDPDELGRNYPNAVSILGDAKVSLRRMIDAAPTQRRRRSDWNGRVQQIVADWRAANAAMRDSDADADPSRAHLQGDFGCAAGRWRGGVGHRPRRDVDRAFHRVEASRPELLSAPRARSAGVFRRAGREVRAARRPVVCFTGDGGFYYHIAELETARRHNINAVIVVNNNSALNQEIKLNNMAYGGKQRGRAEEMWRFPDINFAKVAESFGCVGMRVEKPGELNEALKRAIAMDKPVVVDVVSDLYAIAPHPWTATGRDFHSYQKTGA